MKVNTGAPTDRATETTLLNVSASNASIDTKTFTFDRAAFGELAIAEYTPIIQLKYPYDINEHLVVTQSLNLGIVSQSNSMAIIGSGTGSNSSASLESVIALRYQPGQGAVIRFTAVFTSGSDSSKLEAGYGDDVDGFFFGYSGSNFGIMRRQNEVDNWTFQTLGNYKMCINIIWKF